MMGTVSILAIEIDRESWGQLMLPPGVIAPPSTCDLHEACTPQIRFELPHFAWH
jgi:hypothetical protein